MKDRSLLLLFTSSLIASALIIFLFGIFVRPKILDIGTPLFVTNINKTAQISPKSNYNIYPEVVDGKYLVKFTNVICDGVMNSDTRENTIFRISFTLESQNKFLHESLPTNERVIIKVVRDIMSTRSVEDMSGERNLDAFKSEVRNNVNKWLPDGKISEVYIEGLVGQ